MSHALPLGEPRWGHSFPSVNVRYGIAEQQETGVGTRVYLRVHEAEK